MRQDGERVENKGSGDKKIVAGAGVDDFTGSGDILFFDSLLRYYMSVDPERLPDEKWAWTIRHLLEIRKMERKANG